MSVETVMTHLAGVARGWPVEVGHLAAAADVDRGEVEGAVATLVARKQVVVIDEVDGRPVAVACGRTTATGIWALWAAVRRTAMRERGLSEDSPEVNTQGLAWLTSWLATHYPLIADEAIDAARAER